jgi:hypothetical protein
MHFKSISRLSDIPPDLWPTAGQELLLALGFHAAYEREPAEAVALRSALYRAADDHLARCGDLVFRSSVAGDP